MHVPRAQADIPGIHGGCGTAQSWIATFEFIVGIVVEGIFVAMLIQRFFGS